MGSLAVLYARFVHTMKFLVLFSAAISLALGMKMDNLGDLISSENFRNNCKNGSKCHKKMISKFIPEGNAKNAFGTCSVKAAWDLCHIESGTVQKDSYESDVYGK